MRQFREIWVKFNLFDVLKQIYRKFITVQRSWIWFENHRWIHSGQAERI